MGHKIRHADILLKADEEEYGPGWTDKKTAEAFDVPEVTIRNIWVRFIEKRLTAYHIADKMLGETNNDNDYH